MAVKRSILRGTVVPTVLLMSSALGSAIATADELGDYRWQRRPLLVFAPSQSDPRLAEESQRLRAQISIDANAFSVVLIGKDGGEKLRVAEVPDLQQIYAVIDGMPMRGNEIRANSRRC